MRSQLSTRDSTHNMGLNSSAKCFDREWTKQTASAAHPSLLDVDIARTRLKAEPNSPAPRFALHGSFADRSLHGYGLDGGYVAGTRVGIQVKTHLRGEVDVDGAGPGVQAPFARGIAGSRD